MKEGLNWLQEGFRYSDIRRWGIAKDVMKDIYDITNGLVQKRVWNDRYNRFPLSSECS